MSSTTTTSTAQAKKLFQNVEVEWKGTQIVLPEGMTYAQAREWLRNKEEEQDRKVGINYTIDCYPLDGATAFHRALAAIHGWSKLIPTPGFWGDTPPTMVGVQVGLNETLQVPWGRVQVPGISGYLETHMSGDPITGTTQFMIAGEVKQKNRDDVQRIYEKTLEFTKHKSIYKSQAVRLNYDWTRPPQGMKPNFDPFAHCPRFIDLSGVREGELIFPQDVMANLTNNLFTPIEHPAVCRKFGIPLKRGVLLEGPFGVGKTMTANVTAKKATRNGWTFIYLDSVMDLARALRFADQYAPAVLFAEDIDRVTGGNRTVNLDDILNCMDGVDSKGKEIVLVLTTNDIGSIHPSVLRPGRIDMVVPVRAPDAKAAAALVVQYGRGLISKTANMAMIGDTLSGKIPAVIREVTERGKMAAITRQLQAGRPESEIEIEGQVQETDIMEAATNLDAHTELIKDKPQDNRAPLIQFADAIGTSFGEQVAKVVKDISNSPAATGGNGQTSAGNTSKALPAAKG